MATSGEAPVERGERVETEQPARAVVSDEPMSAEEWFERYGRGAGADDAPTAH
jgi:hypothetical protein